MNEYDIIPYPSFPFPQSHPDRMFTVAQWLGMEPLATHPRHSRILELGCARGENLIPLALELPDAELIGIDLSAEQIKVGIEVCQQLDVANVRLIEGDLQNATDGLGEFDYIIAHGVYSWVPRPVQQRVLEICRDQLKPNGVAFISYNAYPGWRQASLIRDLLLFHTREISDPRTKLEQGVEILRFFVRNIPKNNQEYRGVFEKLLQDVEQNAKLHTSLYHDYLEPNNTPVHFLEFMQHAQHCGLQFLGEASIPEVQQPHLLPEVTNALSDVDPLVREQYYDFLNNSKFRQTLLCRPDVRIARQPDAASLSGLHLTCDVGVEKLRQDRSENDPIRLRVNFQGQPMQLTIEQPLSRAALVHLAEIWPRSISYEELQIAARARMSPDNVVSVSQSQLERERDQLAADLQQLVALSLVTLHSYERRVSPLAGERPCAGPWIRWKAAEGGLLTNLYHQTVSVPDGLRQLLSRLDGSRTREELLAERRQEVAEQQIVFFREGAELSEDWEVQQLLREVLERELQLAARNALLVG